jgi:hypothetical protein
MFIIFFLHPQLTHQQSIYFFFQTKFAPSANLSAPLVQRLPFLSPDLAIRMLAPSLANKLRFSNTQSDIQLAHDSAIMM